ncbi:pepsin/retropepsin-like aspartic protease family protein [Planctomycetota bacterium]
MRVVLISLLCLFLCCIQSGCSSKITSSTIKNISDSNEQLSVRLMCTNIETVSTQVKEKEESNKFFKSTESHPNDQGKSCRIKYHKLYNTNRYMVVEGKIGSKGNRYPVVLDTGASQPIFLNVTHVSDNKLPVFPLTNNNADLNGYNLGLCYLSSLELGDMLLTNRQCFYLKPRETANLFGVSIAGSSGGDAVILGLPMLREFNYVVFDNIWKEAEFSYNKSFSPDETGIWDKYPISIEEDFHNNVFLFIEICIAGEPTELQVDTGSGRGLAVSETLWTNISRNIPNIELKESKDYYPYIGRLDCRRGVIPKLQFGNRSLWDAQVSVFPDDSPLVSESEGLIGMKYFEDTVIALDFERSLMWVRNSGI